MKKYKFLLLPPFALLLIFYYYLDLNVDTFDQNVYIYRHFNKGIKYIIDTPDCKIENIDPLNEEVKKFYWKKSKYNCSNYGLLTYITKVEKFVTLNINTSLLNQYSNFDIQCCYSEIYRDNSGNLPDEKINFSDCRPFEKSVNITYDLIRVECGTFLQNVYSNIHYIMRPPPTKFAKDDRPSILLLGIDGMSKLNLMRTMPKTYAFCESNNWIGLKAYNKIEDNTYPNLMAFLTGRDYLDTFKVCNPSVIGKLDECNFIWKEFKKLNYTTAFAEDTAVSTFNYQKKGFLNPPTDHYLKPYVTATLQLSIKRYCSTYYCTGPENAGQRILDIAKDFSFTYKNEPTFGLFWINSFSHDDINCATTMDDEVVKTLTELSTNGVLENTIVILLSDHGFRYGKIRITHTGYMEERLPFIYFWIPEKFKEKYTTEYKSLVNNSGKLTSPYDLYLTFQHLLKLGNNNYDVKESLGCSKCKSLFSPIPQNRTCLDAGIPDYFCSCSTYGTTDMKRPIIKEIAIFLLNKLNEVILSYGKESSRCAHYVLNSILNAKSLVLKKDTEENILIKIKTFPEAVFEAAVNVKFNKEKAVFSIKENISRLDRYGPRSYCVKGSKVAYYCYCQSFLMTFTNVFCNNIFCVL